MKNLLLLFLISISIIPLAATSTEPSISPVDSVLKKRKFVPDLQKFILRRRENVTVKDMLKLMGRGANLNRCISHGRLLMEDVVCFAPLSVVKLLISRGAPLEDDCCLRTSLLLSAAAGGSVDLFRYLHEKHKLDFFKKNIHGNTALHIAAINGHEHLLYYFADSCVKRNRCVDLDICNNNGDTLLHCAAKHGRFKVVRSLIALGADKDLLNRSGERAHDVAQKFYPQISTFLKALP